MLDSGCRSDVQLVKDFIEQKLNLTMSDLKFVICTHAHPDHSGGASFFKDLYSIPISAPKNINNWYKGVYGYSTYILDIFLTYLVAFKMKKGFKNIYFPRFIDFDLTLYENTSIPGFEELAVLETPGHTDNDISIINEGESWIYIADKIISLRSKYIRPYPITSPVDYKDSLKKLLKLKINKYLLAHHGECKISDDIITDLIDRTPSTPRNHRNTLLKMLFGMLKASIKR